jgi:phosphoglycerate dehydrogenase-like enzyme
MTGILVTEHLPADAYRRMEAHARRSQHAIEWIHLPADPEARLDEAAIGRIEIAFYSGDIYETRPRSFFSAVRKAPSLRWLQTFNAGVDHPIFAEMLQRGIRLTTAAGTTAVPIAQSAITALLMLARGFPSWLRAQREHRWAHVRGGPGLPPDLAGQTICVLGLGSIGAEIARLAQALGLKVIGIRRSPRRDGDPVDEILPPSELANVLPRCQWLAIACPLTAETRKLIDADKLARLPAGARVLNVGRGEIVDEPALVAALRSGHLGGAYLDVFEKEPLPADSPLWDMPDVICTPHNSGASAGNEGRVQELFVQNVFRWFDQQPLVNEVERANA